jgi:hypothetical protein
VTVGEVDGETVRGHYAPENAPTIVGSGAWKVADVERMTLIEDVEDVG